MVKFAEILPYFEKNGIYFSSECIQKNIQLSVSNVEIPLSGYPFLSTDNYQAYEIKLKDYGTVKLKYCGIYFFLNDNEYSYVAQNLIRKAFPNFYISIIDYTHHGPTLLNSLEQYKIIVNQYVTFKDYDNPNLKERFDVEFLSIVSDVRKKLVNKLSIYHKYVQPENLILFDNNRKKIDDLNNHLVSVQKLDEDFFYKILETLPNKEIEFEKEIVMKPFFYSIQELQKNLVLVSIDINKCLTINSLKKRIASELKISDDQLQFIDPTKKQLKELDDYYIFNLSYTCLKPDADILIPGGKTITIKDCYKMKFDEIIENLGQEGFYYSQQVIRTNIHLYLSGEEIPREGFHLLSMRQNAKLELKMAGNTITLNYDGKQFTFSENEDYNEAINLVKKVFKNGNVSIQDDSGKKIKKLIPTSKYHIRVEVQAAFSPIKVCSCSPIDADLCETVADVQKKKNSNNKKKIEHQPEVKTFKFFYSIQGLGKETDFIQIDISKFRTINDLKKQIALKEKIQYEQLKFINPPNPYLKNIGDSFLFTLKISPKRSELDKNLFPNKTSVVETRGVNNPHTIKIFTYSIPEISIECEKIEVDFAENKTADDLKKLIASKLHVHEQQLRFKDHPKTNLEQIKENTNFKFTITSFYPDIDVLIPERKSVRIKDCYKMKFYDIIKYLETKGYYYSTDCINKNFHLYLSGKEIPREGYPLLCINNSSKLEIKFDGNIVVLNYGGYQFTLSENEYSSAALKLVKTVFPSENIVIKDSIGNRNSHLKSSEKYTIRIESAVKFIDIDKNSTKISILVDLFDTGFDIQEKLSKHSMIDSEPENIILFDNEKHKIKDLNKPLINTQKLEKDFYFQIDAKDTSIDEKLKSTTKGEIKETKTAKDNASNIESKDDHSPKSGKTSDKTKDSLNIKLNITINKPRIFDLNAKLNSSLTYIEKIIKTQLKIKDEIVFQYKSNGSMKPIEITRKISEIKDLIQETGKNGKEEYILYVYIDPKPKEDYLHEDKTERTATKDDDEIKDEKKTLPESKNTINKSHKKTPISPRKLIKTKEVNSDDEDKTKAKEIDDPKTDSGIMNKTRKETEKSKKEKTEDEEKKQAKEIDETKKPGSINLNKTMKGSKKAKTEDEDKAKSKEIDEAKKSGMQINELKSADAISKDDKEKSKNTVQNHKNNTSKIESTNPEENSTRKVTDSGKNKRSSSKLSTGAEKDDDINSSNKIETVKKGSQSRRSSSVSKIQRQLKKLINTNTESPTKKETSSPASSVYTFEFDGQEKTVQLEDNSTIESHEEFIKEKFQIDKDEEILFKYENKKIEMNTKMSSFKNGIIHINKIEIAPQMRKRVKTKPKVTAISESSLSKGDLDSPKPPEADSKLEKEFEEKLKLETGG